MVLLAQPGVQNYRSVNQKIKSVQSTFRYNGGKYLTIAAQRHAFFDKQPPEQMN
jgi:hypothetical protein